MDKPLALFSLLLLTLAALAYTLLFHVARRLALSDYAQDPIFSHP